MDDKLTWVIIDKYFSDNPENLVSHQLDSYNMFFKDGIKSIFKEKNPIRLMKQQDPKTQEFRQKCNIYLGGKEGNRLYYGKPVIYDDERAHYMYPNEARLRNMTYGITIHYDVEVEFFIQTDTNEEVISHTLVLDKIFLGRFPIMLQSDMCILKGLDKNARFELGECRNDYGGYFIIDGKEKCILSQEKFANNMIYVRDNYNDIYSHSAEIRSVSEDASKPIRTLSIRIVTPTTTWSNNQLVVNIPNVKKPIPLFTLMRALGVETDKDIIEYCLLDLDKYSSYVDLFIPSIHDAGRLFTQEIALKYIATFTKGKTIPHALEILTDYLLPHIGELNFKDKAYFIGYMVRQLLSVYTKETKPTDRDNFRFKRVELPGALLYDLFKEYYTLQQKNIFQRFDKEYFYHPASYEGTNFIRLIELNYKEFFSNRMAESGFKKAFKGNWGSEEHTKRIGVVQDLNRLSYNSFISHLRKIILPLDASAKVVGPRLLHASQWGIIDPLDTPDGGNVGLHKHMAISAHITTGCSSYPIINWIRLTGQLRLLNECSPLYISSMCKVIVNGNWVGVIKDPFIFEKTFKEHRRCSLIPIYISIQWDIANSTIFIYSDGGRLCRPIFYVNENGRPSYENKPLLEKIENNKFTWLDLTTGFAKKNDKLFSPNAYRIYKNIGELYDATDLSELKATSAIIDYVDTSEEETALIALKQEQLDPNEVISRVFKKQLYTHVEIHPSLLLGVMGNQIVLPENNQLPRDVFACGQAKQAISVYHTNFQSRMDKMGVVLNNGQIPIVKSRYLEYINNEEHPCGSNTIVAIMSWNGYNVEDSILFNEGSLKRGLFRTTYYTMYESHEESSGVGDAHTDTHFTNVQNENVSGLKPGYDYSELDAHGLIRENTLMDDKKVLIGKVVLNIDKPDTFTDASVFTKKGQIGYVDKTFITEGEQGFRIAKVRVREQRIPDIGDKFSSRCGQKGTVGLVIPEEDMPFTANGIKPDIIINPHAIPSRMTIGQLIEMIMGKACGLVGAFGDCTAFVNKGSKHEVFGKILVQEGFHSSGNEILYNGQTGEQLMTDIYIGPTYYMRLKHMVKDKINYRALGPRTILTRQPVQGRANDGGLRIGEMERDGLIAHGLTSFLQESMLIRGDEYFMAICNNSGSVAIYNESYNLFLSPFADGPIKFSGSLMDDTLKIDNISKFGRSFSIIRVPYAFKLLLQELQTMNIQMRIITEENIDQLTNLSFSNNIEKLTGRSVDISLAKVAYNSIYSQMTENVFIKIKLPSPPTPFIIPELITNVVELSQDPTDPFTIINDSVNSAQKPFDDIQEKKMKELSALFDPYVNLRRTLSNRYGFPFATNATIKMYELINEMQLIDCNKPVKVFCDAELPGAFIVSINHFVKTTCPSSTSFDWLGSSYYPESASEKGNTTILKDKYELYKYNRTHWLMGPKPNAMPPNSQDTSGDLMSVDSIKKLVNGVKQRFITGATLSTSDAGIDISDDYSKQESKTSLLNFGQVLAAILSLEIGGNLVTKQFMFNSPFSRSLIALVAFLFEESYVTKPLSSRQANSEVYIVGKNFRGIDQTLTDGLLERLEIYSISGMSPCDGSPLFDPSSYQEIDSALLQAAEKIHGQNQVNAVNEMIKVNTGLTTITDSETSGFRSEMDKKWLNLNNIVKIKIADNLPSSNFHTAIPESAITSELELDLETDLEPEPKPAITFAEQQPTFAEQVSSQIQPFISSVKEQVEKTIENIPSFSILTSIEEPAKTEEEEKEEEKIKGETKSISIV
jgi:DNA-directed RNA polymerase II subunit RPB2